MKQPVWLKINGILINSNYVKKIKKHHMICNCKPTYCINVYIDDEVIKQECKNEKEMNEIFDSLERTLGGLC